MRAHPPSDLASADVILEFTCRDSGPLFVSASGPNLPRLDFQIDPVLDSDSERVLRAYIDGLVKRGDGQTEESQRAGEVITTLGNKYYEVIFGRNPALRGWLSSRSGESRGRLIIAGDHERIHRELWETLREPVMGAFVLHGIAIVRRLLSVPRHAVTPAMQAELRVLGVVPQALKTTRPAGSALTQVKHRLGAALMSCKPATLKHLRAELALARQNQAPFSVVHFEGHGSFLGTEGQGALYFDSEGESQLDAVSADRLRKAVEGVPLVVLDACQAADTGGPGPSWDAVVPQLLREDVQCVIAAPYSVHVDQMSIFAPKLYTELLAGKTICEAVSAGRDALTVDHKRRTSPGASESVGLLDWWTIQLYQQGEDLSLVEAPSSSYRKGDGVERESQATPGEPVLASAAGTMAAAGGRSWLFWGVAASALALLLFALGALVWREAKKELEAQHQRRLWSEWARIEDEFTRCGNQNTYHCQLALPLLTSCEKQRHQPRWSECSFRIGFIKETGLLGQPDLPDALRAYETACTAGHDVACLNLGRMKYFGQGVPQPMPLAARHDYERGCDLGSLEACANAALLFVTWEPELGLQKDPARALQLYMKACNNGEGVPRGCVGVGTELEKQGDSPGAYKWFSLACRRDDLLGCTRQGDLSKNPTEKQAAYRRSCDTLNRREGACTGCLPLARTLAREPASEQEAFRLYEELCRAGCERSDMDPPSCCRDIEVQRQACNWLGYYYQQGELGQSVNLPAALRAFQRSCAAQDQRGCRLLKDLKDSMGRKSHADN